VESGKLRAKLAHDHAVLGTTFNRSGLALTCSADKTAGIWDATGKLLQRIQHPSSVQFGQFSPDGESAATSSSGRDAIVWRIRTGETILRLQQPTSVGALAWGVDNRTLLTGCADGHVRTWDVATGRLLGRPHLHKGSVRHIAVSPKQDVASAGVDGDVRLWRMPEPWTEPSEVIRRSIQRRCGMGMDLKTNAVFTRDAAYWQSD
jgi:WD40 repeat protein